MATANPYDPGSRSVDVTYYVHETGARWFIPYNNNASTAAQAAQCDTIVGDSGSSPGGGAVGSATVAS